MQNITDRRAGLVGSPRWFKPGSSFLVLLAGVALRLLFILRFPSITDDGILYADIAKNWLRYGAYAHSGPQGPVLTYIRLPGYPAFLAGVFAIFGVDHYNAVRFVQLAVDLGTCLLVTDLARRVASRRAARAAFLLTALCPFTANYTAVLLAETWAIFLSALALDLGVKAWQRMSLPGAAGSALGTWAGCGLALSGGLVMRPDAGLLLIVIGAALILRLLTWAEQRRRTVAAGAILGLTAFSLLLPWALRNWRDFHVFQPLAPIAANEPGEFVPRGFDRWQKTWVADYAGTEDIGFRVDGEEIQIADLPRRAFDNPQQQQRTAELFAAYNQKHEMTPEIDAGFAQLAAARIRHAPLRYYVWLPALRALDLWLRPRTELLPLDVHWWQIAEDPHDAAISIGLGVVNLFLVIAAMLAWRLRRGIDCAGLLLAFLLARTAFMAALPNPEPRYVLECYPVLLALGAAGLAGNRPVGRTAVPSQLSS